MTCINDDHFEINLAACLLNQIYVVPVPPSWYDYDPHANVTDEPISSTSTGATASAPLFSFTAWYIIHLWFNNTITHGYVMFYLNTFYTLLE